MFKRFRDSRLAMFVSSALTCAAISCAGDQGDDDIDPNALVDGLDPETVRSQAATMFGTLPAIMSSTKYTLSEPKVALGRQLYYEPRLSKNQQLSCNSCHALDDYGVDRRPGVGRTSLGQRNQLGPRNSPTVYNAARQLAQFWDGRAPDVEEQAKAPILNPVEMAMPSEAAVVAVLKSIPGYAPLFKAAFPGVADPITYANMAIAIGAFERKLVSKDRFDAYLMGDRTQLTKKETHGLFVFMQAGCPTCHSGPGIGGNGYRTLGMVKSFPSADTGRMQVTNKSEDRNVFKVPSLRNVEQTAPYFHDGSVPDLKQAIRTMVEYQTVRAMITPEDTDAIASFLHCLTGDLPEDYIAEPPALAGSATTPPPNLN